MTTKNPRSTVGTTTEIYDFMKLLYARIGRTYSPVSGKEVKRDHVTTVVEEIIKSNAEYALILVEIFPNNDEELLPRLLQQGFARILIGDKVVRSEVEALQFPEMNFIRDMMACEENRWMVVEENEYIEIENLL